MLELLFRGFFEWIYGLIVDIWGFIAGGLLDIMGLDFAYIQSHIPIMDDMARVLMAAGWALLLGNLVFQALKSMAAGLGFEGEDPKLLFARTFVFAFLLLASPQICRIGLDLTSSIMDLLSIPDATNVSLVDESVFGTLTASWLMAIICSVIVMFKVLGLLIEIAERYVILAMLTLTAPLAFAMGGSKNTASIFTGWCRMFGSMCLMMVLNVVFLKLLISAMGTSASTVCIPSSAFMPSTVPRRLEEMSDMMSPRFASGIVTFKRPMGSRIVGFALGMPSWYAKRAACWKAISLESTGW